MFLNRWVATHIWVAGSYLWVAKTWTLVLVRDQIGRQIVYISVLWVTNNQTLRTTALEHCFSTPNTFPCSNCTGTKNIFALSVECIILLGKYTNIKSLLLKKSLGKTSKGTNNLKRNFLRLRTTRGRFAQDQCLQQVLQVLLQKKFWLLYRGIYIHTQNVSKCYIQWGAQTKC